MSISVADNFSYQGSKPLDARIKFSTIEDMVATSEDVLYDGCLAYVVEEKTYYTFDSNNTEDETLGKWVELSISASADAGFTPIGTIINVMGSTVPTNYLECDGTEYNIADYQDLADYFYEQFGSYNYFGGDGTTTFAVPTKTAEDDAIVCIAVKDISLGASHTYSTEEQVVGEWIDGKPIYQITIQFTLPSSITINTAQTITVPFDMTNVDYVVSIIGAHRGEDGFIAPLAGYHYPLIEPLDLITWVNNNVVYFRFITDNAEHFQDAIDYVTVQYTKTTD